MASLPASAASSTVGNPFSMRTRRSSGLAAVPKQPGQMVVPSVQYAEGDTRPVVRSSGLGHALPELAGAVMLDHGQPGTRLPKIGEPSRCR